MAVEAECSTEDYAITLGTSNGVVETFQVVPGPAPTTFCLIHSSDGGIRIVTRAISIETTEQKFRRLADQWREDTEHLSSITKACMHPAYQRIIGMGQAVVQLLLRELREDPDHWFWALNAITERDPAQSEDTFDGAVQSWLQWGRENDYI